MSTSKSLIQAIVNRLGIRIKKGLAHITYLAEAIPESFREELNAFQKEVMAEADRLDNDFNSSNSYSQPSRNADVQTRIDNLRGKVKGLAMKLEGLL